MAKHSLNFQETDHPDYKHKRKAIGAALFKQKLLGMAPTMKRVALNEVKRWQDEGKSEIDIVQATLLVYAKIIMTICCGVEHAEKKVLFELDDGTMESIPVAAGIDRCY